MINPEPMLKEIEFLEQRIKKLLDEKEALENTLKEHLSKCQFDKGGYCGAAVCYSSDKCSARDKNGNPIYDDLKTAQEGRKWKK